MSLLVSDSGLNQGPARLESIPFIVGPRLVLDGLEPLRHTTPGDGREIDIELQGDQSGERVLAQTVLNARRRSRDSAWARTMFDLGRSDIVPTSKIPLVAQGNDAVAPLEPGVSPGPRRSGSMATPHVRQHHLHASPVLDIPHTLSDMRFATHTPTAKDHAHRAVTDAMLAVHLDICCATNEFIRPLDCTTMDGRR